MSRKKKAVVDGAVPQEVAAPKESAVDILARLALEEKAEKTAKSQAEKANYAQKLAERQRADAEKTANVNRKYKNCDHLQGNHKRGELPMRRVSALYEHMFHNGVNRFRCSKCGFKWFQRDTPEYIIRNGKQEPNPTHMGYSDAVRHTIENSGFGSNKPSKAWVRVNVTQTLAGTTEQ
jgi:hypothetical protein